MMGMGGKGMGMGLGGMMGGEGGGFQPMGLLQMLTKTGAYAPKDDVPAKPEGPQNAFDLDALREEGVDMGSITDREMEILRARLSK